MENFVQENENIFKAKSKRPPQFNIGVMIQIVWIVVLLWGTFFFTNRSMYHIQKKKLSKIEKMIREIKTGQLVGWKIYGGSFSQMLYTCLMGEFRRLEKLGYESFIIINGVNIVKKKTAQILFYLCRFEFFPGDIVIGALIKYIGRVYKTPKSEIKALLNEGEIKNLSSQTFGHLKADKEDDDFDEKQRLQFTVLLALLKASGADIYLLDDIATDYDADCAIQLKDYMDDLKEKAVVLFLTSNTGSIDYLDNKKRLPYEDGTGWFRLVEGCRRLSVNKESETDKDKDGEDDGDKETA
ncbi:MAG: hypothetical protein GY940_40260 [bacterium]|nr:hypothetical protein [bacterium]